MSLLTFLRRVFTPPIPPLSGFACIGTPRMSVGDFGVLADTGSMLPHYTKGDMYVVEKKAFPDLIPGHDIAVMYWEGEGYNVPHRVIARATASNGEVFYYTKGDNNPIRDRHTLTKKEYIGVAKFFKDHPVTNPWHTEDALP